MLEDTQNIDPLVMAAHTSFSIGDVLSIITILILLLGTILMSSTESAFFSLSTNDRLKLREDTSKNAAIVLQLLNVPHKLLTLILFLNNFIKVGIVMLSMHILTNALEGVSNTTTKSIIEIILITSILLLFGDIAPKLYGTKNALAVSKSMARPLSILLKIKPINWLITLLIKGSTFINRYSFKKPFKKSSDSSEVVLRLAQKDHAVTEEQKILDGIVKFGYTDVKQIMCPRTQIIAINYDASFDEALSIVLESGYSRIPVYSGTLDNVNGILFSKDLLPYLSERKEFEWQKLLRQSIFVPENKKNDDLLKEFQSKKIHIALVVDEYGAVSGLVTLEDVLEEIVGEITDEFDNDEIVYTKINDKTYLFEGKTALVDFYRILKLDGEPFEAKKGDSETLGGFITENAGRILKNNEYLTFQNIKMIVESSDKKRIKMVKTILLDA